MLKGAQADVMFRVQAPRLISLLTVFAVGGLYGGRGGKGKPQSRREGELEEC